MWDGLQESFRGVSEAVKNLSVEEITWLIIACLLILGFVIVCLCACRFRANRFKGQSCCCHCRQHDEEEYYALLDTSKKVSVVDNKQR